MSDPSQRGRQATDAESDADLAVAARRGSSDACTEIVRRFERPVYNLIVRLVQDPGRAEELTQDTFAKMFRALATYDAELRFSSWLFRIAHNTAIDALRRTPHAVASLDGPRPASAAGAAEPAAPAQPDPLEHRALTAALGAALSQLRPEYRAAISLRYDESLSFEEIGQIMGVPEATARSHVHRARKELSGILKAGGWAP